jgi:hypothetical protein
MVRPGEGERGWVSGRQSLVHVNEVTKMWTRLIAIAVILLTLCGCAKDRLRIYYCGPDDTSGSTGRLTIDLRTLRVSDTDTSSVMDPTEAGPFVVIHKPFPVLLFDGSVDLKLLAQEYTDSSHVFTFTSLGSEQRDWWVVTARPNLHSNPPSDSNISSMVLYSVSDGILSFNTSPMGHGRTFSVNHVPCGDATLTYDDLLMVARQRRGGANSAVQ